MVRFVFILSVLFTLAIGGSVVAQTTAKNCDPTIEEDCDLPSRFIQMGDIYIDGDRHGPPMVWIHGRERPIFTSLVELRRSFVPEIIESAEEMSLK